MKHVDLFNDFLNDTVNLNQTRIDLLEDSIESIKKFVRESDWEPHINGWMPQGSWKHKTIIRPVDNAQFDADLLVFIEEVDGWDAAKYIEELFSIFKADGRYSDKIKKYSHCVTISYANERKLDIAPCLTNRNGIGLYEVCNGDLNRFERSEPKQYTDWLVEVNGIIGNNHFRKVTRLVKYLKVIKQRFTCSSVMLTTLLGMQVKADDALNKDFTDTPTTLRILFGRLDDLLQRHETKIRVENPFLKSEDFAENLTQEQWTSFRTSIHRYRNWIDEACEEPGRYESIGKWQRVFGDEFAKKVTAEEARSVSKAPMLAKLRAQVLASAAFPTDLVNAVKQFGARAIPDGFTNLPHMERPRWRKAEGPALQVQVKADLYTEKDGARIRTIGSMEALMAGPHILLDVLLLDGTRPNPLKYDVRWRITNTDEAAYKAAGLKGLRGEFNKTDNKNYKWEHLEYRGVHMAEAFVIERNTLKLVAQSEPFFVVIE